MQCDGCKEGYHGRCVNITPDEAEQTNTYACPNCQLFPRVQISGPLLHPPPWVFQIKVKMAEKYSITEESEMEDVVEEFLDLQVPVEEVQDLVGPEAPGKGEHGLTTEERRMKRTKEKRRRVRRRAENREQRLGAKVEAAGGTGGPSRKRGANHGPHSGDGGEVSHGGPTTRERGADHGPHSSGSTQGNRARGPEPRVGVWDLFRVCCRAEGNDQSP